MKDMKNTIKVFIFNGEEKIQFVNRENNTTMTYDAQYVLDVLNSEMKGGDDD